MDDIRIRKFWKKATKVGSLAPDQVDIQFAVVRDVLPYEPLLIEDLGTSCKVVSDVSLLFNQQRLDRMSLQALTEKLNERVNAGDVGLSELRKNIKDEDLHLFVKSRYIQSLSELRQWSHYLMENYKDEVGRLRASLTPKPVVNSTSPTGAAPAAAAAAAE